MCEAYIIIAIILFLLTFLILYNFKNVTVYRFHRPTCPYCVASQPEWDKFKIRCLLSRIKPVEINMNDASTYEKELAENMTVKTVPHVVCVYNDGRRYQHSGERTADNYMKWVKSR